MGEIFRYTWIFNVVSIVLVIVTWNIVYTNAKRMATRSESKSAVDHVIKLVNDLSDLSLNFWLGNGTQKDPRIYSMIAMSKINQITHYLNILNSRDIQIELDNYISDIHISTTLDCELINGLSDRDLERKGHSSTSDCLALISHIFSKFEDKYPPEKDESLEEWSARLGPNRNTQ